MFFYPLPTSGAVHIYPLIMFSHMADNIITIGASGHQRTFAAKLRMRKSNPEELTRTGLFSGLLSFRLKV